MSTKKKDLAQELVDFLMKEDDIVKVKGPKLVPKETPAPKNKTEIVKLDKTVVSENAPVPQGHNEAVFEFSIRSKDLPMEDSVKKESFEIDADGEDVNKKTVRLVDPNILDLKPEPKNKEGTLPTEAATAQTLHQSTVEAKASQEHTVSVPDYKTTPTGVATSFPSQRSNILFNDVSQLLAGTEAVKVAQARIKTLEKERDQVRSEIEQLILGSETLQRRLNELRAQHENLERKHKEKIDILEDEKSVLRTRVNAKDEELSKLRKENEELHARFQSDIRKIRFRERELESRQEILKAEMATAISGKDEIIVELKRQLEKLSFEIDTFKTKSADANKKVSEFYDRNHRTVKALRLALSILEVGDTDDKNKKVG